MTMLAAALGYAARGWPVFPCDPRDKKPLMKAWRTAASCDAGQIEAWWRRWPKAMIAAPMGAAPGAFVIDLDLGDPPLVAGKDYLDRFIAHVGGVPHTAIAETASGGYHLQLGAAARRRHRAADAAGVGRGTRPGMQPG